MCICVCMRSGICYANCSYLAPMNKFCLPCVSVLCSFCAHILPSLLNSAVQPVELHYTAPSTALYREALDCREIACFSSFAARVVWSMFHTYTASSSPCSWSCQRNCSQILCLIVVKYCVWLWSDVVFIVCVIQSVRMWKYTYALVGCSVADTNATAAHGASICIHTYTNMHTCTHRYIHRYKHAYARYLRGLRWWTGRQGRRKCIHMRTHRHKHAHMHT
jgi:hypothetical protein